MVLVVVEGGPGPGANDAILNQAVVALELPYGSFGPGAEYAVRIDTDSPLDLPDQVTFGAAPQRRPVLGTFCVVVVEGGPGPGANNAVLNQAVVALELPHGSFGPGAEYAVRIDTDPLLDLLNQVTSGTAPQRWPVLGALRNTDNIKIVEVALKPIAINIVGNAINGAGE